MCGRGGKPAEGCCQGGRPAWLLQPAGRQEILPRRVKTAAGAPHCTAPCHCRRFFGGGFGGGFGFQQQQEEETPKGNNVAVELEVTLADLYLGGHFKVVRDKNVVKPAPGTRKCNCKQKVVTQQMGPGMYQQYTTQVRQYTMRVLGARLGAGLGVGGWALPRCGALRSLNGCCHRGRLPTTGRVAAALLRAPTLARLAPPRPPHTPITFPFPFTHASTCLNCPCCPPPAPPTHTGVRGLPQRQVCARARGAERVCGARHA